jgi:hypothetical protein
VRPLADGPLRAVTPEGYDHAEISPDGREMYAGSTSGGFRMFSVEGGEARSISGLAASDQVVRWSPDGGALWVRPDDAMPVRLDRLDLATGRRTPLMTITPASHSGLIHVEELSLAADPRAYAYLTEEQLSHVFVVHGMR